MIEDINFTFTINNYYSNKKKLHLIFISKINKYKREN